MVIISLYFEYAYIHIVVYLTNLFLIVFRRSHIDRHNIESGPHLPKLNSFKWRVDVAISTRYVPEVVKFIKLQ